MKFSIMEEYVEIKIESLKELGDYALGLKLLLKCRQATYLGVCHHVLHDSNELLLEQVSVVSTGTRKFGVVIIFHHDVITMNVIGVDMKARKRLWKGLHGNDMKTQGLLMKQILPPSLYCDDDNDFSHNISKSETATETPNHYSGFACNLYRPTDWTIIDSFDEEYKSILHELSQEKVVSIFGCGPRLGRHGILAWLSLEVGHTVYILDVATLTADAFFKSELASLLQDKARVKVLHNGRKLVDYLHHRHKVNLTNVYDTQASDIYLECLQERTKSPLLVRSLPALLYQHLPIHQVSTQKLFPVIHEEEESLWMERPLPDPLIFLLIHSVIFLRELREVMLQQMLAPLYQVNQLFLDSLKDESSTPHHDEEQIIPKKVQKLFKQSDFANSFKITYSRRT